jgi:uncharacterized ion transporter superfamily protein YfcC
VVSDPLRLILSRYIQLVLFVSTSGDFIAVLALAGVPWQEWLKFYLPLFAGWAVIALGLLTFAQLTAWS